MFVSGKSGGGKESPDQKKDESELWSQVEAQAAFLGPNLWEKTLPYDADLKVSMAFLTPMEETAKPSLGSINPYCSVKQGGHSQGAARTPQRLPIFHQVYFK